MRISDWSSDVCSSDLRPHHRFEFHAIALDVAGVEIDRDQPAARRRGDRVESDVILVIIVEDCARQRQARGRIFRSEEHTSELQSLMRISYAVFCLKKKNKINNSKLLYL